MSQSSVLLIVLFFYTILLIAIGLWTKGRNKDQKDFFLGGRNLGPIVASLSYSASAASAWTLLGLTGLTYAIGVSSIWVVLGSFMGALISWFWIAPRLMNFSKNNGIITLTDFITFGAVGYKKFLILIISSLIVLFCFSVYVAAQFQGAGNTFSSSFGTPMSHSIIIGGVIVMIYTFLGGFWAVSITDTVQGFLMAITALVLPIFALIEVGGFSGFIEGIRSTGSIEQLSFTFGNSGLLGLGVIIGSIAIGVGQFGQPHLLIRFMALKDKKSLKMGFVFTIIWYLIVFLGMYFVGLVGHILIPSIENNEAILFALSDYLFSPIISGIIIAAVLSAIMSTADSQLLVTASVISYDLGLGKKFPGYELYISRLTIIFIVCIAIFVAIIIPSSIFDRVVFAWVALGCAFGPLVFTRLAGIYCGPNSIILSILIGFSLAVFFSLQPSSLGFTVDRLFPFLLSLFCLLLFKKR